MSVQKNIQDIRARIPDSVKIVGVVKRQRVDLVREGVSAGLKILGVNYVQEGAVLQESLGMSDIEWHFIGHIQSRKVKNLLQYHTIQSLDRWEIAADLNQRLEGLSRAIYVYVEVNIGNEPQKSGVPPHRLGEFLNQVSELPNLKVIGLMCLPPPLTPVEARRPHFKQVRKLFEEYQSSYSLETLSMGTSEDFEIAVDEGSNMIRLGTSLFGARTP